MPARRLRPVLERLYRRLNSRTYVEPDPLQFLYAYPDVHDREIVALVAAGLAVGRVRSILRSVAVALEPMGPRPARWLAAATPARLAETYAGFRHRFLAGDDVASMLAGARSLMREYGSLEACFVRGMGEGDETVLPALATFVDVLNEARGRCSRLVPAPRGGSACKRLHLMLRWLVRRDDVDPGGWTGVPASRLVVPLDVHMHRIGAALGLTARRQADAKAALEVTAAFRAISPDDPVRYDFALTRLGIRTDTDLEAFLAECRAAR
jgi:uncharacterized protein (TIGR02757 family)